MHFRVFFHQFPTIFCTFAQTLRVFLCTLAQLFALPASSFSVLLYKLFLHIVRKLHLRSAQLFGTFAQTFSSLPPHFFQLVRNFVTICFQLFHSFLQLFLMRLQLFPSISFLFLLLFPFVMFLFLQRFSLISFMLLQRFSPILIISP